MKEDILSVLEKHDQSHILSQLNSTTLSTDQKEGLKSELGAIELEKVFSIFQHTFLDNSTNEEKPDVVEPVGNDQVISNDQVFASKLSFINLGNEIISKGLVAVVTLAGGQGTRLGFEGPKGKYDINLPSRKSLFQLQAERISNLIQKTGGVIPWYIMTSPLNHNETTSFFQGNNFFGLKASDVKFFQQGVLPCFDFDGKLILKSPNQLLTSPDGNGGVYASLKSSKCFEDMERRGVKFVNFIAIDNSMVVPADPRFVGSAISRNASLEVANLASKKQSWDEKLGVFALKNKKLSVLEYSEISEENAKSLDEMGDLKFRSANTCNHLLSLEFLKNKVFSTEMESEMHSLFHVARKKLPYFDLTKNELQKPTENNVIKLELFIFDVFKLCDPRKFVNVELDLDISFSPVKNASGAASHSPEIARKMLLQCSTQWLLENGAEINDSDLIEVSPLVSAFGEELESLRGVKLSSPGIIVKEEESHGIIEANGGFKLTSDLGNGWKCSTANTGLNAYFLTSN